MTFSLFGFPVEIQPPAFLLAGVVFLWGLSTGSPVTYLLALILVGAVSILVHEMGHALSARAFGAGPISIALHGLGGATRHRRTGVWWKEVLIILAGPGAGFVLAAVCALLLLAPLPAAAMGVIELAVLLNIAWGIFNLLPLFPMDGGQALAYGLQSVVNPLTAWTVAHVMGLVVAVGLALYAFKAGSLWIALIVGMFAYQNWQGLQHIQQLKKQRER